MRKNETDTMTWPRRHVADVLFALWAKWAKR